MSDQDKSKKVATDRIHEVFKIIFSILLYSMVILGMLIFVSYLIKTLSHLWG